MMTETTSQAPSTAAVRDALGPASPPRQRLGEELPVFCEKCGYSLHGLPQTRCEQCAILQFHCPECGHHQPINTLRPAAQRILGRLRATGLAFLVLFKLNYFGWLLFAWFAMGVEWSMSYRDVRYRSRDETEMWLAFIFFAAPFGMVSRMLLLRWRRSLYVGIVLALIVMAAIVAGQQFRWSLEAGRIYGPGMRAERIWLVDLMIVTGAVIALGALIVWPIWALLVRAFLPRRAAAALLEWQESQSDNSVTSLART
jgi:hypothetical protein